MEEVYQQNCQWISSFCFETSAHRFWRDILVQYRQNTKKILTSGLSLCGKASSPSCVVFFVRSWDTFHAKLFLSSVSALSFLFLVLCSRRNTSRPVICLCCGVDFSAKLFSRCPGSSCHLRILVSKSGVEWMDWIGERQRGFFSCFGGFVSRLENRATCDLSNDEVEYRIMCLN